MMCLYLCLVILSSSYLSLSLALSHFVSPVYKVRRDIAMYFSLVCQQQKCADGSPSFLAVRERGYFFMKNVDELADIF